MPDGDDATDVDVDESSFLTGVSPIDGVSFSGASGINSSLLAKTLVGSGVFALAVGVNTLINGVTDAVAGLITGVQEFLAGRTETGWFGSTKIELEYAGIIDILFGTAIAAIRGAWSFSLTQFGVLAYPVGVAVLLGTFLVAQRGIDRIAEAI